MIRKAIGSRKRIIIFGLVTLVFVPLLVALKRYLDLDRQQYSFLITNRRHGTAAQPAFENEMITSNWRLKRKGPGDQIHQRWLRNNGSDWRCSVHTVGCFKPTKSEEKYSWVYYRLRDSNLTDWQCIQVCSQRATRKIEMVGVRASGRCICAHYLNYSSSLVAEDECSNLCDNENSSDCTNEKSLTRIYQVRGGCTSVSELHVEDARIGCFSQPQSWKNDWEHYVSDEDKTSENCFVRCEIVGYPLAAMTNQKSCYCGRMTHELSQLLESNACSATTTNNVTVYKTLNEDRRCTSKRFLHPGELKMKIGLISFPGSGNTWTRYLIESATGIYTGSAYGSDWGLLSGGFIGELLPAESSKVSVIKSHSASMHGTPIDAVINIYRNPYDAMMAEFKRRSVGHVGNLEEFNRTAFKKVVTSQASGWLHLTQASAQMNMPRLIIPFEEMVADPVKYAEKMARFILGENLNEADLKERLLCLKYSSTGGFKRPKKRLSFDPYDKEMKTIINRNIDILAKQLEMEGFSGMPDYKRALTR